MKRITQDRIRGMLMTPTHRVKLAYTVYSTVHKETESFELNNIGSDLAYLLGAIVSPEYKHAYVDWSDGEAAELLKIIRKCFGSRHRVWAFIILEGEGPDAAKS